jgi:hypothetical protein
MQQLPSTTSRQAGSLRLAAALAAIGALGLGVVFGARLWRSESPEDAPRIAQPGGRVAAPAPAEVTAPAALQQPGPKVDRRPRGPVGGLLLDDATGKPVLDFVLATLPGPRPSDESAWEAADSYPTSGPAGVWEMPILPNGSYTVRFTATGYEDAVVENVVNPAPLGEELEVRMQPGRWVHGTVRDAQKKPVPGFAVRLVPEQLFGSDSLPEPIVVETDASGAYSFPVVPAGRWHAELAGLEASVREPIVSEPWELTEPREVVWDPALPPLSSVRLAVKWNAKRFIMVRTEAVLTSSWGSKLVVPLQNDAGTFERVEPGTYELTVGKTGEAPWHRELIEVPASATPIEWARTITPPEREKPAVDVQRPRRNKGGGGQKGAAVETSAGGEPSSVSAARGARAEGAQPGASKSKRKKKGG